MQCDRATSGPCLGVQRVHGRLSKIEKPAVAASLSESIACGPNPDKHAAQVRSYLDADIDEVYVQQIGPDVDGFFANWHRDVLLQLRP